MSSDVNRAVFKSMHEVFRQLKRRFEEQSRAHNLTLSQWRVIYQLTHSDSMNQTALAALIDVTPMTMSGIIERLEARGLVERFADPADSRAKLVRATPQSKALAEEGDEIRNAMLAEALGSLSLQDRTALADMLAQVANTLSQRDDSIPEPSK